MYNIFFFVLNCIKHTRTSHILQLLLLRFGYTHIQMALLLSILVFVLVFDRVIP